MRNFTCQRKTKFQEPAFTETATMNDKDLDLLTQLAEDKLKMGISREDALNSFVTAGIMDENGQYTKPYRELENLASE